MIQTSSILDRHFSHQKEAQIDNWTPKESGVIEKIHTRRALSLDTLKQDIERGSSKPWVLREARIREAHFFSMLKDLDMMGAFLYRLDRASKKNLWPVIDDIIWLYRKSEWEERGKHLEKILKSTNDEPYDLEIVYQKDPTSGKYQIISIVCILNIPERDEDIEVA